MLDPPGPLDDFSVMADWVELSVLTANPAEIDRDSVGESLDSAGLLGLQDGGLFEGDLTWLDEDVFTPEDESDRYTEILWAELLRRSADSGHAYPFDVSAVDIRLKTDSWRDYPGYMLLLLLDHGRSYAGVDVSMTPNSSQGRLLEKVVEAAAAGVFKGPTQRFGWPREPDWPTGIVDRIGKLAELLDLLPEGNVDEKTTPDDKDKGLDVVASLALGAGPDSTAWFLVQCACGENWRDKVGEPSLGDWQDLFVWKGRLVKALAVPWRLVKPWDVNRTGRKFEAVVLERDRLSRGRPDSSLHDDVKSEIVAWCEPRISALPYAAGSPVA
jgi:hypothetical protein